MAIDPTVVFGHCSKSVRDLARTFALVVQGTEVFRGGFYLGAEFWRAIQFAFHSNRGDFNDEMRAIQRLLEKVMDPQNPVHHNFVDCLYCPDCREAFCGEHSPDFYKPPTVTSVAI